MQSRFCSLLALRRRSTLFSSLFLCVLVIGCSKGPSGPKLVELKGVVTLDSVPIEKGSMTFDPADGKGGAYVTEIVGGAYLIKTEVGDKKVSIVAYKEGKGKDPFGFQIQDQYVPAKYNTRSTLKYSVLDQPKNEFDFQLVTK